MTSHVGNCKVSFHHSHQIKKPNMVVSLVLVFLFTWLDLCGCVMLATLIQCYVLKTVLNTHTHIYIMIALPFSLKYAALFNEVFISQKIHKSCLNYKCYLKCFHCVVYP